MERKTRIILADDHPLCLEGLRAMLASAPDIEVVGQSMDGKAAWALITEICPDVALLDIRLPLLDGLGIARLIRGLPRPVPFIFLTMWMEEAIFNEAMALGCSGYLLKECAAEEIVSAIRMVASGRRYLSPSVSDFVMRRHERLSAVGRALPALALLTPAEKRVLRLVADNKATKEIAEQLGVSPRTVDNQRARIVAKLGLRGSHSLIRFAFEHRLYL